VRAEAAGESDPWRQALARARWDADDLRDYVLEKMPVILAIAHIVVRYAIDITVPFRLRSVGRILSIGPTTGEPRYSGDRIKIDLQEF
jgi:hypothetical protein